MKLKFCLSLVHKRDACARLIIHFCFVLPVYATRDELNLQQPTSSPRRRVGEARQEFSVLSACAGFCAVL